MKWSRAILPVCFLLALAGFSAAEEAKPMQKFEPMDVFQLEYAADPQISPDGNSVVYARTFMDIMKDSARSNLWLVSWDGSDHRPLTSGSRNDFSPRWSPDGKKLLYASTAEGSVQLYLRWMDTGQTARLTQLTRPPRGLSWSPDGKWIAFLMFVPDAPEPLAALPAKPEGAVWAQPPKVIRSVQYRADGVGGFLEEGYSQLFVLSAEGGTPRQLTEGRFNVGSATWTPDSQFLLITSNRRPDWEYDPVNSEIYEVSAADGAIRALTDRQGPDTDPVVSPDGRTIAYLGFDDRYQGYQLTRLYLMNRDASAKRLVTEKFDREVDNIRWSGDSRGLFFQYDDKGNTKIAYASLDGRVETVAGDVGGLVLDRPYAGGSFTLAPNGRFAFTYSRPDHPADVAVGERGRPVRRLTRLNDDLLAHKTLGAVEELWWESSYDKRKVHGWIVKPPGFDPSKKYPLVLEIHGGPFANYGDRFAADIQLYAAAGYVVLYTNPRGSTSYGEEFGNLIHHNYPGQDYDDLMSGVDAALAKGYVDPENLFVTGGSGGGVLTSWIVGKTKRFRAAVVAKPVINWYSFVLTSDGARFFYKYWFPGFPWDHPEHYLQRSPLSLVGNVTTPTMLLTGEQDYRTPIGESEQYYQALKLRKIDTALVRIQEASHDIAGRPSNLINKVAYILAWFEKHRRQQE